MLSEASIELVPLAIIRPTERHYPEHADSLAADMRQHALWRVPIVIERSSNAVMDGHHRLVAARQLGLYFVPCLRLDYTQVRVSAARAGYDVCPADILRRALAADPYPPKTTRHEFDGPLPLCNLSLTELVARPTVDSLA
ncbi:MAG TPA: ParB N-terminal domain-containing protein [Stenotrophomonas sp.]|nr:ParB N-terminal domain-containing protein [Stenotrophomonas sp.]